MILYLNILMFELLLLKFQFKRFNYYKLKVGSEEKLWANRKNIQSSVVTIHFATLNFKMLITHKLSIE